MRAASKIPENIGGAEIISEGCNPYEVLALDTDMIGFISSVYGWKIMHNHRKYVV